MSDIKLASAGIQLPAWVANCVRDCASNGANSIIGDGLVAFPTSASRMALAIALSKHNARQQTGGPFGAAIFDSNSHQLVSVGVNLVVPSHCSINHAEIVAITLAQQSLQTFSLREKGEFELFTSCEPCAMCFGAIPWSGIQHLACAAHASDAEAIGFDEGPKPKQWIKELEKRGIAVTTGLNQTAAAKVLQDYHRHQGTIYNG